MPLTPEQITFLQELICEIETSECGEGEIRIVIKNRHVRTAFPAPACYFPIPENMKAGKEAGSPKDHSK